MKAMILAAGVGNRLMPMTRDIPKPMVPVANVPLMENIVGLLAQHGLDRMVANLHYHGDQIREYFGDGARWGVEMHYSVEEELMGTAGGVKRCQAFLDETFVIVSGDALTDIDLSALVAEHKRKGALATIALKEVEEVELFGIVITDEEGRISSFQEKPQREEARSNLANTGIYVFEPEIFNHIPADRFYDFGKEVFPALVREEAPFYGVRVDGYWCDIGSMHTYSRAQGDVLQGRVKARTRGRLVEALRGGKLLLGDDVEIDEQAIFAGNVVLGDRCVIGGHAFIADSVIWSDTYVGNAATLEGCVIGSHCHLGAGAKVRPGSAIASGCILTPGKEIIAESRVYGDGE